jgi:hypothetical protein
MRVAETIFFPPAASFLGWFSCQFATFMPRFDVIATQTTNSITDTIFLWVLLLSVWQIDECELWQVLVPDCCVVASRKKETAFLAPLHVFRYCAQASAWTQHDWCSNTGGLVGPTQQHYVWRTQSDEALRRTDVWDQLQRYGELFNLTAT